MIDSRISAETKRFAVLGESLPHTWSPFIHNSLFKACGREAVYLPITVPKSKLSSAIDVLGSCFSGFNVTIPYKELIIPYLDEIDDAAKACGAVNTVENRGGKLIGHITDGLGMLRAIEEGGVATFGGHVLVLGGGGAARVAAYEFLQRGNHVTIAVRSIEKGRKLASELASAQTDGDRRIHACTLDGIPEASFDLLINCTPVGMYPSVHNCPVSENVIGRCRAVFDAVYNPRETALLSCARAHGLTAIEGLGMLFYQAVEAQKFWFGSDIGVPNDTQSEIYRQLFAQLS